MSFRNMLTMTGASLGAGALALAPTAANAAAISTLNVASTNASGSLVSPAIVEMPVYASRTTLFCSSGSVTGTWNTHGALQATFSGLSLTGCTSILGLPGTVVTLSLNSGMVWTPDPTNNVNVGKTDSTVTGTISGAANAVKVSVTGGCSATLGGTATAVFDEVNQTLSLTGNGFTVSSVSGLCLGAVSSGNQLTMQSVTFALGGGADYS